MTKTLVDKLKYVIPVLMVLAIMLIVEHPYATVSFSRQESHIVDASSPFLGQLMFGFLWQYRGMDVIIQAFFLFTAIISCVTLLRADKEGQEHV